LLCFRAFFLSSMGWIRHTLLQFLVRGLARVNCKCVCPLCVGFGV